MNHRERANQLAALYGFQDQLSSRLADEFEAVERETLERAAKLCDEQAQSYLSTERTLGAGDCGHIIRQAIQETKVPGGESLDERPPEASSRSAMQRSGEIETGAVTHSREGGLNGDPCLGAKEQPVSPTQTAFHAALEWRRENRHNDPDMVDVFEAGAEWQAKQAAPTVTFPTGEQLMVLQKAAVAYCADNDDFFESDGVPTDDVFKDGAMWAWRHPLCVSRPASAMPDTTGCSHDWREIDHGRKVCVRCDQTFEPGVCDA